MSPGISVDTVAAARFPRVSGDEPTMATRADIYTEFSPRERG